MWCSQGSILGSRLFFIYVDGMKQDFQHKNATEIKKDFKNVCDWFIDNELIIHFGEEKTKSTLFFPKRNFKLV